MGFANREEAWTDGAQRASSVPKAVVADCESPIEGMGDADDYDRYTFQLPACSAHGHANSDVEIKTVHNSVRSKFTCLVALTSTDNRKQYLFASASHATAQRASFVFIHDFYVFQSK